MKMTRRSKNREYVLRSYQEDALNKLRELAIEGRRRQLPVFATGLGKTVIFAHLSKYFPEHARQGIMCIVHTDELAFQAAEKLQVVNPSWRVGIEKGNYSAAIDVDIVVGSVQTLGRAGGHRLRKFLNRTGIIIIDEAHRVKRGGQYARILNAFNLGNDYKEAELRARPLPGGLQRLSFGWTATPNRHDGQGLKKFYDCISVNYDLSWGIENGWLVDIEAHREKTSVDLDKAKISAGDFGAKSLADVTDVVERNMQIVNAYKKAINGEFPHQSFVPQIGKAISFLSTVEHAHHLATMFNENGVRAAAVDGTTDKSERKDIVQAYAERHIQVLCNVGVFTHGFDDPETDIILGSRPTMSKPLYMQMMGRGSRTVVNPSDTTPEDRFKEISESEKPMMMVIDFADNTKKHRNLASAPSLAGFRNDFNPKGKKMFTVAKKKADRIQKKSPGRPVFNAVEFDDFEVIAEKVGVWDIQDNTDNDARRVSNLKWIQVGPSAFQIKVPLTKNPFTLRIEGDHLDRWRAVRIYDKKQKDGKNFYEGKNVIQGLDNAINASDDWLKEKADSCMPVMKKKSSWNKKSRKATKSQMNYLKRLGVPIPDGMKLPIGIASDLISRAKALETQKKLEKTRSKKL